MEIKDILICPKCKGKNFTINREVTYNYKYKISSQDFIDNTIKTETLPFTFDNREKIKAKEFISCDNCKAEYNINLHQLDNNINFTIIEKAIRSDLIDKPEFIG